MAKSKIVKVRYFTKDKLNKISPKNLKYYEKYLQSNIIKNREVKDTTYKTYKNFFMHWLAFLAERYDNIDLYSDEFMENAVDIMEDYIAFCQDVLHNNKKVINTKLSAVSSFYIWSMKRGFIKAHPFDNKLDRMKNAQDEHIINSYFLTPEQVQKIRLELSTNDEYDIQDQIIFEVAYDSANRLGALERLTLSSLDLDEMVFRDIREKRAQYVEVVFEERAKELIAEWLEMRKDGYDKLECDALFITKYKGEYRPMSRETIYNRVRKIGKIVGIDDFRPHCIRKSRLNNIYEETGDLTLAAELANHQSTETTRSAYIKPMSKTEIRDKINALRNKKEN